MMEVNKLYNIKLNGFAINELLDLLSLNNPLYNEIEKQVLEQIETNIN